MLPATSTAAPRIDTLDLIGRLWLAGVDIDWAALHSDHRPGRVPLPTYPFERRRFWIDPAPANQTRRSDERRDDIANWFYLPVWHQAPRLRPRDLAQRVADAGPWLVAAAGSPIADSLVDRLRTCGAQVEAIDVREAALESLATRPRTVLYVDAGAGGAGPLPVRSLGDQQAFGEARRIVGALAAQSAADPVAMSIITRGAVRIVGGDRIDPASTGLIGLARVAPQENPGLSIRVIDVGETGPTRIGDLVDQLLLDAMDPDTTTLGYRDDDRWRQEYDELEVAEEAFDGAVQRDNGTYLLTGGLGDVCLAIADHLAQSRRARLALLTRSAMPPAEEWDGWLAAHPGSDRTSRRIGRLRALEAAGAEILVVTADIADRDQVAAAVRAVQDRFGPINGVVHGAGMQGDAYFGLAHELCDASSYEHFRAKVLGLGALAATLDLDQLDFCITLSSLATVLGAIGHAAYAAANAAMDGLAEQLFADGHRRVLTVDWDSWQNGEDKEYLGGAATIAKYRMSYAEGVQAVERALTAVGCVPHLVNSTGDIVPRLAAWVATATDAQVNGDRHPRPPLATPFVEPADDIEAGVAEVWQDIMGLEEVGVLDSFFELGGHSLMAVQLIGRIRKVFKVNLPLSALAEAPTVRDLSVTVGLLIEQLNEHRDAVPDRELDLADSAAPAVEFEADEVLMEESA